MNILVFPQCNEETSFYPTQRFYMHTLYEYDSSFNGPVASGYNFHDLSHFWGVLNEFVDKFQETCSYVCLKSPAPLAYLRAIACFVKGFGQQRSKFQLGAKEFFFTTWRKTVFIIIIIIMY